LHLFSISPFLRVPLRLPFLLVTFFAVCTLYAHRHVCRTTIYVAVALFVTAILPPGPVTPFYSRAFTCVFLRSCYHLRVSFRSYSATLFACCTTPSLWVLHGAPRFLPFSRSPFCRSAVGAHTAVLPCAFRSLPFVCVVFVPHTRFCVTVPFVLRFTAFTRWVYHSFSFAATSVALHVYVSAAFSTFALTATRCRSSVVRVCYRVSPFHRCCYTFQEHLPLHNVSPACLHNAAFLCPVALPHDFHTVRSLQSPAFANTTAYPHLPFCTIVPFILRLDFTIVTLPPHSCLRLPAAASAHRFWVVPSARLVHCYVSFCHPPHCVPPLFCRVYVTRLGTLHLTVLPLRFARSCCTSLPGCLDFICRFVSLNFLLVTVRCVYHAVTFRSALRFCVRVVVVPPFTPFIVLFCGGLQVPRSSTASPFLNLRFHRYRDLCVSLPPRWVTSPGRHVCLRYIRFPHLLACVGLHSHDFHVLVISFRSACPFSVPRYSFAAAFLCVCATPFFRLRFGYRVTRCTRFARSTAFASHVRSLRFLPFHHTTTIASFVTHACHPVLSLRTFTALRYVSFAFSGLHLSLPPFDAFCRFLTPAFPFRSPTFAFHLRYLMPRFRASRLPRTLRFVVHHVAFTTLHVHLDRCHRWMPFPFPFCLHHGTSFSLPRCLLHCTTPPFLRLHRPRSFVYGYPLTATTPFVRWILRSFVYHLPRAFYVYPAVNVLPRSFAFACVCVLA